MSDMSGGATSYSDEAVVSQEEVGSGVVQW